MIPACSTTGDVDFDVLEQHLQTYQDRPWKLGAFAAASNVTGILSDVDRLARLLHQYGAYICVDAATAAPYQLPNMNPVVDSDAYKDAVLISPHKMLGGVGTPGVLVVKRSLVSTSQPPRRSGGGTVFYVTHSDHRFLSHRVERYEGGTPNITGIIRCGLTFLCKRQVESAWSRGHEGSKICDLDCATRSRAVEYLQKNAPNLIVLGEGGHRPQLPILSFLVRFGNRFLHYNYVCAILNDVFGIQSRGGCQCSGPFSQFLLGLTVRTGNVEHPSQTNRDIESALYHHKERAELLRPGYTRLSLPFKGLREMEVDYVLRALVWVAKNGWALLCQYRCNHRTGEWRHMSRQGKPLGQKGRKWLGHYQLGNVHVSPNETSSLELSAVLEKTMETANQILTIAKSDRRAIVEANKTVDPTTVSFGGEDDKLEALRWYAYPKEVAELLLADKAPDNGAELWGALRPRSSKCLDPSNEESNEMQGTKKRKGIPVESSTSVTPHLIPFRDGDHDGEAPLAEIVQGCDDGELSENCKVYCDRSNQWLSITEFQNQTHLSTSASTSVSGDVKTSPIVNPNTNALKKAARGEEVWGQRHLSSDPPVLASEDKANGTAPCPPKPRKRKRFLHTQPPPKLMKLATQAIMQWNMIQAGDRLLLGLSGGKDSLSLLHCLMEFRRKLPTKFEIEVCTIDPMTPSFDPSPLIPYVESLGLKYHYIKDDIVARANSAGKDGKMVSSLCAFCARMKRGSLYTCARENKCNKLVLAQHLDDCVESTMMVSRRWKCIIYSSFAIAVYDT